MLEINTPHTKLYCKCAAKSHARIFEICDECPIDHKQGLDIEAEIMAALAQEITTEIDNKILASINKKEPRRCYE